MFWTCCTLLSSGSSLLHFQAHVPIRIIYVRGPTCVKPLQLLAQLQSSNVSLPNAMQIQLLLEDLERDWQSKQLMPTRPMHATNLPGWQPIALKAGLTDLVQRYQEQSAAGLDQVWTSYFTSTNDPQRHAQRQPDRFSYMREWYLSLKANNMSGLVFHDGLSKQFRAYLRMFNVVDFAVAKLNGRSTNDGRFYAYLKHLDRNEDIHRVLLTDVSDVRFQYDPFYFMKLMDDNLLYIGRDLDIFLKMQDMGWMTKRIAQCKMASVLPDLNTVLQMDHVYNAGMEMAWAQRPSCILSCECLAKPCTYQT
eukprot:TRINITY_DN11314_c0_g1_i2.p1 TRINITY_DN11314_c0_g1~~TRINITY_DN11314_c0_g1_i2.p1  ORF type:complete len:307 (+),score=56.65 TRINITY_DN11314_c0_g1_i2:737-1657(+)